MKKLRAFLAVNLSVPATRAVADLGEAVRRELGENAQAMRVAWVPAANLHVTLKFLGWTSEEALEAVADRLRRELLRRPAVEVRARGLGVFPTATSPRVIWCGLEDLASGLGNLARDVDKWMSELGFIKEERPFRAHLTLGRVKEGRASMEELIGKYAEKDCGTSVIREVVVYESRLRAQGAEYVARARVPLGGGGREPTRPAQETKKEEAPNAK